MVSGGSRGAAPAPRHAGHQVLAADVADVHPAEADRAGVGVGVEVGVGEAASRPAGGPAVDLAGVAPDARLEVRGAVEPGSVSKGDAVPTAIVTGVRAVPAPADPYEYRARFRRAPASTDTWKWYS